MIRAVLNSVSGELIVDDTNFVSWNDRQNVISRSESYHGVMISESLDLTFIGAAYEYLLNLDETYDIAAECEVKTQLYTDLNVWQDDFVGYIDFTTKSQNDNSGNQITYSAYSDNFSKKLLEREDIKIPYDRLTTLDDSTITPFTDEYGTVQIFGMEILNKSALDFQETLAVNESILFPSISTNNLYGFNSTVAKDGTGGGAGFSAPNDAWVEERAWFVSDNSTGTMSGTINLSWKLTPGGSQFASIFILDYEGSLTPTFVYDSGSLAFGDPVTGLASTSIDFNYDFSQDSRLAIVISAVAQTVDVYLTENKMSVISIADPTNCEFVPPNQAFERTIEAITDNSSAFLSDYFTTGEGFYILLTNGKLIRQYPTGYLQTDENQVAQLTFSLKDLFENYNKVLNIGAGVEYASDQYNLRVEEKSYFYDSDVILEIDKSEIEIDTFVKERDLKYYYNTINAGYGFEKIEEDGAMEDYNTKSSFSTPIVYESELDLISEYNASGYAIETSRRKEFDIEQTTDYKFDNDNFFFSTALVGSSLVQRTDQDFSEVNGIDNISTPINLFITPGRNLRRHGWIINTGLKGYQDKTLKYNDSEITTDLETRLDSESEVVRENEDINITDLDTPLFSGNIVRFNAPVGSSTFNLIKNNPYQLIKYWDMLKDDWGYGWIKEVSSSPIDKSTNWELIEANNFTDGESFRLLQDGAYRLLEDGSIRLLE